MRGAELRVVEMPLKAPFRTSLGTDHVRELLLVRWVDGDAEGWGECVAESAPLYCSEYVEGVAAVMRAHLLPMLFAAADVRSALVATLLAPVSGHRMAKATLEMAVLDAELRQRNVSLAQHLGSVRRAVPAGVSIGIQESIDQLLECVGDFLGQGYQRIKLKIEPGWDLEPVAAVRECFGDILLQVDANAAYQLSDARHLARLDGFDLAMIEQPLGADDLRQHAALATMIDTPICLDESVVSAAGAADAIAAGAAQIINIKPGRVGGYLEARRVHDVAQAHGVPVWCGGMLESGLGRRANIALAALPGFVLPGDTSASDRFYLRDLTDPVELVEGTVAVPTGPGIGATPHPDALAEFTVRTEWITP